MISRLYCDNCSELLQWFTQTIVMIKKMIVMNIGSQRE